MKLSKNRTRRILAEIMACSGKFVVGKFVNLGKGGLSVGIKVGGGGRKNNFPSLIPAHERRCLKSPLEKESARN